METFEKIVDFVLKVIRAIADFFSWLFG